MSTVLCEWVLAKRFLIPSPAEGRAHVRSYLQVHYDRDAGGGSWEQDKYSWTCRLSADLRFTLTFRPLASQQRNYRARCVIVPAVGGTELIVPVEQKERPELAVTGKGHFIWALHWVYICPPSPARALSFAGAAKIRGLPGVIRQQRAEWSSST